MTDSIRRIDHTLVGVADLEAARTQWTRLGFTCTPRGRHIGWGTANYCIMFGRDYIELLGIVDPAQFTNNLDRFLEEGEGGLGFAFQSGDVEAAQADLAAKGIVTDGPKDLARSLELPEGDALPKFKLLFPAAEAVPELRTFLCQHLTSEILRRPDWLSHANGAQALHGVAAMVADPAALAPAYERLLGAEACQLGEGELVLTVGPHEIRLLAPAAAEARYPERPAAAQPGTQRLIAQSVVAELDAAARHLDGEGVAFARPQDGVLRVPPAEANGIVLDLVGG